MKKNALGSGLSLIGSGLPLIACVTLYAGIIQSKVPDGYRCLSRDKKFLATFSGRISIHDEIEGKSFFPIQVLQPIYLMAWAQDSRSLFYVENIAGGSSLSVVQFWEGGWLRHDVDPPGEDFDSYAVTGLNLQSDPVLVRYVTSSRVGGKRINEVITFNMKLKDLSIFGTKRTRISPEEYNKSDKQR